MTRDDIIKLAQESGMTVTHATSGLCDNIPVSGRIESLIRFANLVAAAEREACANLCAELAHKQRDYMLFEDADGCDLCADAVRARGDK